MTSFEIFYWDLVFQPYIPYRIRASYLYMMMNNNKRNLRKIFNNLNTYKYKYGNINQNKAL